MTTFVTLVDMKSYLGITNSNTDALIEEYLATTNELIVSFCGTSFEEVEHTNEIQDGRRADIIVPDFDPIISVEALRLNVLADGTGGTTLVPNRDYVVRETEIALRFQFAPQGRGLIGLDYTSGYAAVPTRVKTAQKIAVQGYYNMKTRNMVGVTSKSKEGESISYKDGWSKEFGLPQECLSLLQEYRSIEWPANSNMATRNY